MPVYLRRKDGTGLPTELENTRTRRGFAGARGTAATGGWVTSSPTAHQSARRRDSIPAQYDDCHIVSLGPPQPARPPEHQ